MDSAWWPFDQGETANMIGAALGALLRWGYAKYYSGDRNGFGKAVFNVFTAVVLAYYCAPIEEGLANAAMGPFVTGTQPSQLGFGGLMLGICGAGMLGILLKAMERFGLTKDSTK